MEWYEDKIYYDMCKKAIKIQELWEPKEWDHVVAINSDNDKSIWCIIPNGISDSGVYGLSPENFNKEKGDKIITWLPSQYQLQGMIEDPLGLRGMLARFIFWLDGLKNKNLNSMEQLWLAFVMKEKYNKMWDSKDWRGVM